MIYAHKAIDCTHTAPFHLKKKIQKGTHLDAVPLVRLAPHFELAAGGHAEAVFGASRGGFGETALPGRGNQRNWGPPQLRILLVGQVRRGPVEGDRDKSRVLEGRVPLHEIGFSFDGCRAARPPCLKGLKRCCGGRLK